MTAPIVKALLFGAGLCWGLDLVAILDVLAWDGTNVDAIVRWAVTAAVLTVAATVADRAPRSRP